VLELTSIRSVPKGSPNIGMEWSWPFLRGRIEPNGRQLPSTSAGPMPGDWPRHSSRAVRQPGRHMDISLPDRVDVIALILGAAFVAMGVSAIGAPLSVAASPAMRILEVRANWLVLPAATLLNCATVGLVLLAVRWLSAMGTSRPGSIPARNAPLLAAARVVALVYLAQLVVGLAASEIRWFFEVPFFNITQFSMQSVQGRVFLAIAPLIGLGVLVILGPHILGQSKRSAV
jgi:hypothetical protein